MDSIVLLILSSRLLLHYEGSGANVIQVVLSRFSVRLLCFVPIKLYVGMVVCIFCFIMLFIHIAPQTTFM